MKLVRMMPDAPLTVDGESILSWSAVSAGDASTALRTRDDETLVRELLRTGDDDLFAELVSRHKDRVFRLAVSILGPGHEDAAEDLTQEVFLQVFRKLATFRQECAFSTWLYRMTRNAAIDRRRRARFRHPHVDEAVLQSVQTEDELSDPEQRATTSERRKQVRSHLERLPEPQRSVVYLHYWLGSPIAEIAGLLELKRETVKSHLHRARKRLASQIPRSIRHG
jgi:RNA polymerase sigma-70 factor (ECF subfamily)